jgi:hypothetical protein
MSPTKTREEGENNKDVMMVRSPLPSEEVGALLCDMFLLLVSPTLHVVQMAMAVKERIGILAETRTHPFLLTITVKSHLDLLWFRV